MNIVNETQLPVGAQHPVYPEMTRVDGGFVGPIRVLRAGELDGLDMPDLPPPPGALLARGMIGTGDRVVNGVTQEEVAMSDVENSRGIKMRETNSLEEMNLTPEQMELAAKIMGEKAKKPATPETDQGGEE